MGEMGQVFRQKKEISLARCKLVAEIPPTVNVYGITVFNTFMLFC